MTSLIDALHASAASAVDDFYGELARLPKSRVILEMLDEAEREHLKRRQVQNLLLLAAPEADAGDPAETALRLGRIHAIVGLDKEELAQSRSILAASVYRRVGGVVDGGELSLFNQRLNDDLMWQLKAYQKIEDSQQSALLDITRVTWESASYADLIARVVTILARHEEIAGSAIGRPDEDGVFHFEAAAGEHFQDYIDDLLVSPQTWIVAHADDPRGQGAVGRAWRGGHIERIINFRTHPLSQRWGEFALKRGLRSCAAVPLKAAGAYPIAILILYSSLPGGFVGAQQKAFLDMLQTVLSCAFERLGTANGLREAMSIRDRQHLAALVRSEALRTWYQPLVDLRSGRATKVEALARIEDGRRLLAPAQFLPALVPDDLLEIYVRGLEHALTDREAWLGQGVALGISINLPPVGLSDIRYFEATEAAVTKHGLPPEQLTLEVLETEAVSLVLGQQSILTRFKALGVMLAQDDLGSGHSGLTRLRQLPFDSIKIDRDMVRIADNDALDVLRFVYQLTRLGHAMGKQVVAEGIESPDLLDALAIFEVDLVQGYAVSRPMPAHQVVGWTRRHAFRRAAADDAILPQLAGLLVWEERLASILDTPPVAAALARAVDPDGGDTGDGAAAPAADRFVASLIGLGGLFPGRRGHDGAWSAMVDAALHHGGPHGHAYAQARQRLVDSIMGAGDA